MFKRLLIALGFCALSSGAWAQNATCPTRSPADSSNACASTAFVQNTLPYWVLQGLLARIAITGSASDLTGGAINNIPIGLTTPGAANFTTITGPVAPNQTAAGVANVSRVEARQFVGQALNANDGGDFYHTGTGNDSKDWLESNVQGSTTLGQQAILGQRGTPTAAAFGVRTSDALAPGGFGFATAAFGLNDAADNLSTIITRYGECRSYTNAGTTQCEESDAINLGGPSPHLGPYDWGSHLPMTANLWLSNGRPDIEMAFISGTLTVGDTLTLTATAGFTGAPVAISHTVITGDTVASVATALAFNITWNATFRGLPTQIYAASTQNGITLGNSTPSITWTGTVTGAGTESFVFTRGNQVSIGAAFINNCNASLACGAYVSGIFFDANSLAGTDGSDGSTGVGEAMGLARHHSLNWYVSGTTAPVASLYSDMTSAFTNKWSMRFRNDSVAVVNATSGADVFLVGPAGMFIPGSGGTPVAVTFGAANSGGAGFRQLLIPN